MKMSFVKKSKSFLVASFFAGTAVFTTSCGDGSSARNISINGVDGPKITLNQDNVLVSMTFENIYLDGGLRYAIPKYQKSYVEISPALDSNGTLMAISISLDDVFGGGLNNLDPQTLPGGRALPGVATGRLPAVAFSIEKFRNMTFYVGPKIFGIFVPIKNLGIGNSMLTARHYVGNNRVGNISLVGEDHNGENAGILLMLDMNAQVQKRLKAIANQY